MSKPLHRTAIARFWPKVEKRGRDECWPWKAAVLKSGYGILNQDGDFEKLAHRIAWTIAKRRPIPDGMLVMHVCDTPGCVNPRHLTLGTDADNMADMVQKGRSGAHGFAKENKMKTHCPRGHAYAGDNLQQYSGRRYCRTCRNEQQLAAYHARKSVS